MVTEYDVGRRVTVFERDEHAGRHVRSVDYSPDGELGVSGSDDGVAQLWDTRCGGRGCVGVARAGAAEEPIWVRGFEEHEREAEGGFVSAVSWRQVAETEAQEEGALLAGGSNGALQAFVCKRKTRPD
ncbi:hypothetical protein OPV22_028526 [Ensete ventricosum]|uniref:Anaphase-promoting complex subunit 4 WD40 domain-containing protein n=1 Tax=Ensete ventricosum TaxID=4639 RepID=A0AAV8Q3C2_ENSVE|nr:hypothetical protein OPV22_028526 [Ensete ventricosum]